MSIMPQCGWVEAGRPLHFEHPAGAFLFWRHSSSCWVLVSWATKGPDEKPRPKPAFVKVELMDDDPGEPPFDTTFTRPPAGVALPWRA